LYPVETYVFAFAVSELATGLYHYVPLDGVLEQLRLLPGSGVANAFLPPGLSAARPPLMVALSAVFERTQLKYLERGYRFTLLEAGHMAQNLLLLATALCLNAVPVGGFWDEPFNETLGFDPAREAVIYAVLFGCRASETK
jgi:SagB-type dehydrogenase family enzyme